MVWRLDKVELNGGGKKDSIEGQGQIQTSQNWGARKKEFLTMSDKISTVYRPIVYRAIAYCLIYCLDQDKDKGALHHPSPPKTLALKEGLGSKLLHTKAKL